MMVSQVGEVAALRSLSTVAERTLDRFGVIQTRNLQRCEMRRVM